MEYDFELDQRITKLLIKRGEPVYDADIWRHLEQTYKKSISPVTYSSHKKKLLSANVIKKIERGNRGRIKYYISEMGKQQDRLGILGCSTDYDILSLNNGQTREERQLKVHFLLLSYATRSRMHTRPMLHKENSLPGFSITEILQDSYKPVFPDTDFKEDEIKRSLELLQEEKIMKIHGVNNVEIRYDLADECLKRCLEACWRLWERFVIDIIISNWEFFRKSSVKERDWLKHFFRKRAVDKNERIYYSERLSFRKTTSKKDIQLHEEVIKEMFDEIERDFRQIRNKNSRVIKIMEVVF